LIPADCIPSLAAMKSDELDTGTPTLDGNRTEPEGKASPPLWRFRVLYAGFAGIVETEALAWTGRAPLGVGRRSASPSQGPWLHVADERVSREHARVSQGTDEVCIQDLHTRNGTWLNGVRLSSGQSQPLHDGDVLRLADSFILVRHEPDFADVPIPWVVGQSRAARLIRYGLMSASRSERPLLLLGETGTGKEVAAVALHQLSRRKGRLMTVNCAAVPATLAEAHFFGVLRGAFTDATAQPGVFMESDQGTLFLDEVGELPIDLQPKLLRVLETGEVVPVGSQRPLQCNVRVVAATNRDLALAMRTQRFREDLYARLAGQVLHLPPLRERREDVLLLLRHFLGAEFRPSPRLVAALLAHAWPFNIRELGNVISHLRDGSEEDVLRTLATSPAIGASPRETKEDSLSKSSVPTPTHEQLDQLLTQYRGNLRRLEIERGYSRRQVHRWVDQYGLDLEAYRRRT